MKKTFILKQPMMIAFIAICFTLNADANQPDKIKLHHAFREIGITLMTNQEYCDRLMQIHDTLNIYHEAMVADFTTAYKASPRTWGIIAKYRKYLQDYCQVNLVYLYKLPPVGEAKEFRSSLGQVVADNWDMTVICQEFEDLKPGATENILAEIFERLVAKKNKWEIDMAVFYAKRDLYKIKYGLK